tara:strand:+ start:502 stop:609 length:108 start_codon:yes stop_codon:yes gene_type:complete
MSGRTKSRLLSQEQIQLYKNEEKEENETIQTKIFN